MLNRQSLIRYKFFSCTILLFLVVFFMSTHIIYNPTHSVTKGYYFSYATNSYHVGDLVMFCVNSQAHILIMHQLGLPTISDECILNTPYLLKRIVASNNDTIQITDNGISINGILYSNSHVLMNYKNIPLLPIRHSHFTLKKDEFIVLGNNIYSYDSRYFGVIQQQQIYRQAWLLFASNKLIW